MQPLLPLQQSGLLYECLNPDCFYCEALMKASECEYKNVWNSTLEVLDFIPVCASCGEYMVHWEDK